MHRHPHAPRTLALIAAFKFAKAAVLGIVAFEVLRLEQPAEAARVAAWLAALPIATGHEGIVRAARALLGLSAHALDVGAGIASVYSALYATEGIGLWRDARWAKYLTSITTGLLIPVELWEVVTHFAALKLAAFAVNVAILAYLVRLLRSELKQERHEAIQTCPTPASRS
jgi:uncharacterized membrane protein (DUF2068 family)